MTAKALAFGVCRRRRRQIRHLTLLLLAVNLAACSGFVPAVPDLLSRAASPRKLHTGSSVLPRRSSPDDTNDGSSDSSSSSGDSRTPLNVAIVGAGPSGLLLAHRLLSSPVLSATVALYEQRPDPRKLGAENTPGDDRAYALGLGPRARFAIRSVDDELWEEVLARGNECDRFTLHVTPRIRLRLRDGVRKLPRSFEAGGGERPEPSVLIYQTDLCAALVDGLVKRHGDGGRLEINFGTRVVGADATDGSLTVQTERGGEETLVGPHDFIAGCGGVKSPVRRAIESAAPPGTFTAETRTLPGDFKVARLPMMPPLLDPTSVALVLPGGGKKKGGKGKGVQVKGSGKKASAMSAFVEPVAGGGACVLFAGRGGGDGDKETGKRDEYSLLSDRRQDVIESDEISREAENILERFPLFEGIPPEDLNSMVRQILSQRPAVASSVKCNAFHFGRAALCGDAAHATGGVSGQGVNSALIDAAVLAECVEDRLAAVGDDDIDNALLSALLAYSQRQVPEGLALYELSFGPEGDLGLLGRVKVILSTLRDTIFGGRFGVGRPLLQVQLSSSLRPFAEIRRERSEYYGKTFPDQATFNRTLEELYGVM